MRHILNHLLGRTPLDPHLVGNHDLPRRLARLHWRTIHEYIRWCGEHGRLECCNSLDDFLEWGDQQRRLPAKDTTYHIMIEGEEQRRRIWGILPLLLDAKRRGGGWAQPTAFLSSGTEAASVAGAAPPRNRDRSSRGDGDRLKRAGAKR